MALSRRDFRPTLREGKVSVVWYSNCPTPQFAPILNYLHTARGLSLNAVYSDLTDRGRGWGEVDLNHPVAEATGGLVRKFFKGVKEGCRRDITSVVVLGYSNPFAVGLLLSARSTGKLVYTQSDSSIANHRSRPSAIRLAKKVYVRTLFPSSTRVWTITEGNSEFWHELGLHNQERVAFESRIPRYTGTDGDLQRLRDSIGAPTGSFFVTYVGRKVAYKRIEDICSAVKLLRSEDVPVHLLLVGDDFQGGHYSEKYIHELGGRSHAELAAHYLISDCLAIMSDGEAYGLVVAEATQFGLPVVSSDGVPAAREIVDRGWNIVPVGDVQEAAKAIRRVYLEGKRWESRDPVDTRSFYFDELIGPLRGEE